MRVVTVYAFSIENFKRTRREVDGLMALAELKLAQLMQHNGLLQRYGIRIRVLGDRGLVRADLRADIERAEAATAGHGDAVLNVCFPYTSRDEMTQAVKGTVEAWTRPLAPPSPRAARTFSQTHISNSIRSRRLSNAPAGPPAAEARGRETSPDPPSSSGGGTSALATSDAPSDAEDSTTLSSVPTNQQPITPPDADAPLPADPKTAPHLAPPAHEPPPHPLPAPPAGSDPPPPTFPDPESIDAATLTEHMFTAGTPPVDLLIRTSGVERLSDFLLWQVHEHTEIVFLKCLWPEFDLWQFLPVLVEWQWRRRKETSSGGERGLAAARTRENGVKVD